MDKLNEGEMKIYRALERLNKLWKDYGDDLVLFNGNILRRGVGSVEDEITLFPDIKGGGGDGGDSFF